MPVVALSIRARDIYSAILLPPAVMFRIVMFFCYVGRQFDIDVVFCARFEVVIKYIYA